jgi:hypothetical protein
VCTGIRRHPEGLVHIKHYVIRENNRLSRHVSFGMTRTPHNSNQRLIYTKVMIYDCNIKQTILLESARIH